MKNYRQYLMDQALKLDKFLFPKDYEIIEKLVEETVFFTQQTVAHLCYLECEKAEGKDGKCSKAIKEKFNL